MSAYIIENYWPLWWEYRQSKHDIYKSNKNIYICMMLFRAFQKYVLSEWASVREWCTAVREWHIS